MDLLVSLLACVRDADGMGRRDAQVVEDRISVQTFVQDAVDSVKAFFDIAVQAMNDKADQFGFDDAE